MPALANSRAALAARARAAPLAGGVALLAGAHAFARVFELAEFKVRAD
jgi:hypothetical protein